MAATSYAEPYDLNFFFENFVEDFYEAGTFGTQQCHDELSRVFKRINDILHGFDHIATLPVPRQTNGSYPESLIEWQSRWLIYQRLVGRYGNTWGDQTPRWVEEFKTISDAIRDEIEMGNIIFSDQLATGQYGLTPPSTATQRGMAVFHNSYNMEPFPYLGADYTRSYRIVIDGTSAGNGVGQSTFKWSNDNGVSFSELRVSTGTSWTELEDNVNIRWEAARSLTGTQKQIEYGDEWYFNAIPDTYAMVAGKGAVKVGHLLRG